DLLRDHRIGVDLRNHDVAPSCRTTARDRAAHRSAASSMTWVSRTLVIEAFFRREGVACPRAERKEWESDVEQRPDETDDGGQRNQPRAGCFGGSWFDAGHRIGSRPLSAAQ